MRLRVWGRRLGVRLGTYCSHNWLLLHRALSLLGLLLLVLSDRAVQVGCDLLRSLLKLLFAHLAKVFLLHEIGLARRNVVKDLPVGLPFSLLLILRRSVLHLHEPLSWRHRPAGHDLLLGRGLLLVPGLLFRALLLLRDHSDRLVVVLGRGRSDRLLGRGKRFTDHLGRGVHLPFSFLRDRGDKLGGTPKGTGLEALSRLGGGVELNRGLLCLMQLVSDVKQAKGLAQEFLQLGNVPIVVITLRPLRLILKVVLDCADLRLLESEAFHQRPVVPQLMQGLLRLS